MIRSFASTLTLFALFLVSGCTVHEPADRDGGGLGVDTSGTDAPSRPGDIRIEPANAEYDVDGVPVVIDYRAFQRQADGSEAEVTGAATWSSTVDVGSFVGAQFTSRTDRGGLTNIRAQVGPEVGNTTLLLRSNTIIVTDTAPADAPTRFGGTPVPAAAPEVVYPEDGTMIPPNLGELEFHYRTNGSTVFELSIGTRAGDVRIYFGCPESVGGGCIYTPDRGVWEAISTSTAGLGPVTYTLRGVDDSGRLGEAPARTLIMATEAIRGGLYYWNAGGGSIDRFEFGVRGARAERFIDQARAGATTCVGCHTLSRDGRRIAIGTDIPTTSFQVFDVASRTRIFMSGSGGLGGFPSQPNFSTFSPDASELISSGLSGLLLRSGTTGATMGSPLTSRPSTMPDWSPDGNHVVYVEHNAPAIGFISDVPGCTDGVIRTLDRSGSSWVPGATLVPGDGTNHYYPAYSPDGSWVVYNRSPSNTNSMGSDTSSGGMGGVLDAELWVVSSTGGAPIQIVRADGLADSWPKWDPTSYLDRGRTVFWLAWSSRRGFGLRYADGAGTQLWMAAFDPALATSGMDPVMPAFRLPFQDIATGNHIAQWVTSIERQTCSSDSDCGGEFCIDGRCYEEVPLE
jgi:hypothetical protein